MKKTSDPLVASSGPSSDGSTVTNVGSALDTALLAATEVVHFPGLEKALAGDTSKKKTTKPVAKKPKEKTVKTEQKTPAKKTTKKPAKTADSTPAPAPVPQSQVVATPPPTPAPAPVPQSQVVATPPPTPAPAPAQMTRAQKLEAIDGSKVMDAMEDADKLANNKKVANNFAKLIVVTADGIALRRMGLGYQQEWEKQTLGQVEDQLTKWAHHGDKAAESVLADIMEFDDRETEMFPVVDGFWELVTKVVRPANKVKSFADLTVFLMKLEKEELVTEWDGKRALPDNAVSGDERGEHIYLPAMDHGKIVTVMEAGWDHVRSAATRAKQQAEQRVEQIEQDVEALMNEATPEFFPSHVKAGDEGKLCFKISPRQAALIAVSQTQVGPKLEFIRMIGLGRMPTSRIGYEAGVAYWPHRGLFGAFQWWKNHEPTGEQK